MGGWVGRSVGGWVVLVVVVVAEGGGGGGGRAERDGRRRVRVWLIVIYILGAPLHMDWSNVQVASGADGCAAYSTG